MKTEIELKQYLAKMLADKIGFTETLHYLDKDNFPANEVLDTELLDLCRLAEMKLTDLQYVTYRFLLDDELEIISISATWQQRVIKMMEV